MEDRRRETAGILREHLEELVEIAWNHKTEKAYEIAKEKWKIGSVRSFYEFVQKERITTYKKTAWETMTQQQRETFSKEWKQVIDQIDRWRRKK